MSQARLIARLLHRHSGQLGQGVAAIHAIAHVNRHRQCLAGCAEASRRESLADLVIDIIASTLNKISLIQDGVANSMLGLAVMLRKTPSSIHHIVPVVVRGMAAADEEYAVFGHRQLALHPSRRFHPRRLRCGYDLGIVHTPIRATTHQRSHATDCRSNRGNANQTTYRCLSHVACSPVRGLPLGHYLCDANLRSNAADLRLLVNPAAYQKNRLRCDGLQGPRVDPVKHPTTDLPCPLNRLPDPLNDPRHRPLGGCCARGGMRKQNGIG